VEAGLGVSIVPQNSVKNEAKARTLVPIEFTDGPYTRSIGVIHQKGRELGPTAEAFLRLVTAGMGER
jgi:DNA-binding transcriptional LysR family regulator